MCKFNLAGKKSDYSEVLRITSCAVTNFFARIRNSYLQKIFKQREKSSLKRSRWIWLIIFVPALPYAAFGANHSMFVGSGDNYIADAAGLVSATWNNPATSDLSTYGFRWNIATEVNGANYCNKGDGKGYIAQNGVIQAGVTITKGVIMHFTAGNLTNTISETNQGSSTGSATLTTNGTMTNLVNSRAEGNQVLCTAMPAGTRTSQGSSIMTRLTGGKVFIYVDETAEPGTYTIPPLYLAIDKGGAATTELTSAGTLTILPKANCTVNTLATVPFGDITSQMAKGNGVRVSTHLEIACMKMPGSMTSVFYSVKPKTQSGDNFTLPMLSEAGGIAGDIRGFLGSTANTDAGCADKKSSMRMDNTPVLLRNIYDTESWSDSLTWVLCPRADAKPGPAKAIAAIELNW